MKLIPIAVVFFLAGCMTPAELIEARAKVERLEAEQASREAALVAAEKRLQAAKDPAEVKRLQQDLDVARAALSATQEAVRTAEAARVKWQTYTDSKNEATVARYTQKGLEIGDTIFAGLLPFLQGLFPGLGALGLAAGAWETIRRKKNVR